MSIHLAASTCVLPFESLIDACGVDYSTYGDGANHKVSVTGGLPFAQGKGHFLISGEAFTQKGIQSINRAWNDSGFFQIDNPAGLAVAGRAGTCTPPAGYVAGTPIAGCGPARSSGRCRRCG